MAAQSRFGLKSKDRDSYLELVLAFPLCSIRSDEHLEAAQKVIDRLLSSEPFDDGTETYFHALSDLVALYEDVHHPLEPASDADMLRHLLDSQCVTQTQLSLEAGIAKSSISEVLAGRKQFSRGMIRKLADYFKIDVSVLTANL